MTNAASSPATQLRQAVEAYSISAGDDVVTDFQTASKLVTAWLDYFVNSVSKGTCDDIILACRAALIEAAGCLSLGLVRPAIFAIRLQYELFLAWPYFNDHTVEWKSWQEGRSEFPLRAENVKYLKKHSPRMEVRLAILQKNSDYSQEDPYSVLSKVVHGSSYETMPDFEHFAAISMGQLEIDRCIELQTQSSQYLSDVAASWLTDRWHDIPVLVKQELAQRLPAPALVEFCRA